MSKKEQTAPKPDPSKRVMCEACGGFGEICDDASGREIVCDACDGRGWFPGDSVDTPKTDSPSD